MKFKEETHTTDHKRAVELAAKIGELLAGENADPATGLQALTFLWGSAAKLILNDPHLQASSRELNEKALRQMHADMLKAALSGPNAATEEFYARQGAPELEYPELPTLEELEKKGVVH